MTDAVVSTEYSLALDKDYMAALWRMAFRPVPMTAFGGWLLEQWETRIVRRVVFNERWRQELLAPKPQYELLGDAPVAPAVKPSVPPRSTRRAMAAQSRR